MKQVIQCSSDFTMYGNPLSGMFHVVRRLSSLGLSQPNSKPLDLEFRYRILLRLNVRI